jgi:hypothetical protein
MFTFTVRDARAPHSTAGSGGFGIRKVGGYQQRRLVKKLRSLSDGFADGTFAQVKCPDRARFAHTSS